MRFRLRFTLLALTGLLAASCQAALPARAPAGKAAPAPGTVAVAGSPAAAPRAAPAPSVAFAVGGSPLALTASDGTGLRLAELHAQAVVDGPLAFTELRLTFENPADRQLEGTFRITLPQGASLGRFAMKIGGEWQEGEVVELAEARRAYEDFLHRKQDPALMEKSAGNEFSARVFPIPARGTKEIIVAYAHEVHDAAYVLPLRGLPDLGILDVKASVVGAERPAESISSRNVTPDKDFVVEAASLTSAIKAAKYRPPLSGMRSGELALVRVRAPETSRPEPLTSAVVLVDTSASRVLGFEDELKAVARLMKSIAEGQTGQGIVTVAAFDQTVAPIFEGRAADFGEKELATLRERGALGASDLERALKWAHGQAKKSGRRRVVLVGDGVATAGATDPKKLAAEIAAMRADGVERIDALAVGGIRDDAGLLRLVRGQLAHDGIVADVAADPIGAVRRLGEATRSGIAVKVEGATWAWPTKLDGVQAGDSYSVYVQLPEGRPMKVSVDGKPAEIVPLRATERPLLERVVAQAKIASMLEREATSKVDLKKAIVGLAVQQRILTPYTAMLVLETEQDYARFHIERKSLMDVLAVENGGVKRVHRTSISIAKDVPPRDVDEERDSDVRDKLDAPKDGVERREHASSERKPAPLVPRPPRSASPGPGAAPAAKAPVRPRVEPANPYARSSPSSPPSPPSVPLVTGNALQIFVPGRAHGTAPYEGQFAVVMERIAAGDKDAALETARAWQMESPGDVLALVALGEAAEAKAQLELAGRAYGSVLDLFPNRADLRRFVGERLERLSDPAAAILAIDAFRKAVADRPDHPSSHRLLAFALLRNKQYASAFEAALAGARRAYDVDRFEGVDRILREDLGLIGAAWARAEPARRDAILARVGQAGGRIENAPSLRFVLDWQTDANDVDFHIHDAKGGHAFYSSPHLDSGGDLYADVTTGYGPECFTIRLPKAKRSVYTLEAHYYSRGPMGYGMGKLEVIDHDGNGNLTLEERPFIVMVDSAYVDLGTVK